jgi:tetratricopeptide (TPR) repeat protein
VTTLIKAHTQELATLRVPCLRSSFRQGGLRGKVFCTWQVRFVRQGMSQGNETLKINPEPAFPMMQACFSFRRWTTNLFLAMCVTTVSTLPSYANEAEFQRWRLQSEQAEARGDIPQSIRAALKMIEIKPNDVATMLALSGLYGMAGQADQQLFWTKKILKLQPKHFDALVNQGNAHAVLGNAKAAKDSFSKARDIDPSSPVVPYSLGVLAQTMERDQEAIGFFQAALKLAPNFEDALFNLAVSQANVGLAREVIATLDRLLKINTGAEDARLLLDNLV